MSLEISSHIETTLRLKKLNSFYKLTGLLIMTTPIIVFVYFMIAEPERMGKTLVLKVFSILMIAFLLFVISREIYFFVIDKNRTIHKSQNILWINNHSFKLTNVSSILIVEYNGVGIMSNGFNIYLKLINGNKLPMLIRVGETDMLSAIGQLSEFLNIKKIERKKNIVK